MRKLNVALFMIMALVLSLTAQPALAQADTDPESVVLALADAWDARDVDAAVALYAEDALVEFFPADMVPDAPYEGTAQITEWLESELAVEFEGEYIIEDVDGDTVFATHLIANDELAELGLEALIIFEDITVVDGLIVSHAIEFSQQTLDDLEAAIAELEAEIMGELEAEEETAAEEEEPAAEEAVEEEPADDEMADEMMADEMMADEMMMVANSCDALPTYDEVTEALVAVVAEDNGGFGFDMWATLVDRSGVVCVVTRSGDIGEQWPGSRVIAAQKANTANAFSLPGLALSTANLYNAVQPGASLFGLQESNPVDTEVAYAGDAADWGTEDDAMVGYRIGGVNVFGGGLALYDADGVLLGALGVSGDSSCADHAIGWKLRDALALDYVPGGVSDTGDDNMVFDPDYGFGHPECGLTELDVVPALPESNPLQ